MRDHATLEQLLVLANLESMNAELIHLEQDQPTRLQQLNSMAIRQLGILSANATID